MAENDQAALETMAALVASKVQEEQDAQPAPDIEAITPDFVSRCSKFTEKGDGILHSALFRGKLVYVPEIKTWYVWTGQHWETTHIHRVEASVEEVGVKYREIAAHYDKLATEARDAGDKEEAARLGAAAERLTKRANYLNSSRGVNACIKFTLANADPLITKPDIWDVDPWLLGVTNGVVDLRTGEHRPGRPSDFMRRACPVEWKGLDTPAPIWEQSLSEIIGTYEGVIDYLHKVLGYAITGQSTEPLFLMLYGDRGRNGKTVIMETLKKVLGPYMGPVPAEMLLDRNVPKDPDSASPTIMNLNGLRVVWASETNENRRFSTSQVKLLSGSDSLTGRYLWDKENTEFRPTHTLFLLTNFLPRAPAHDTAFWERLKLINFPYRFVDQPTGEFDRQRNPKLEKKLEEELPGILAWLVRGCLLYEKEGLIPPPSITQSTADYRVEEDTMQLFIEQCLQKTVSPEERLSATEIYEVYHAWYKKYVSAKTVPSMHVFGRQLSAKLERRKVGGHTYYFGVEFSDDGDKLRPGSGGKSGG